MCSRDYGKVHLESNLARDVKNNKKGFSKYISSKRNARDNVGLLLDGVGAVVMRDTEYVELLSCLLQTLLLRPTLRNPKPWRQERRVWSKEDFPLVEQDQVRSFRQT